MNPSHSSAAPTPIPATTTAPPTSSLPSLGFQWPSWLTSASASAASSPLLFGLAGLTTVSLVGGGFFWWRRRQRRLRAARRDASAETAAVRDESARIPQSMSTTSIASTTSSSSSTLNLPQLSARASSSLSVPRNSLRAHPSPSPSPRLADIRPTEHSAQLSSTLLRAKAKKEAREERAILAAQASVSSSPSSHTHNMRMTPTPTQLLRLRHQHQQQQHESKEESEAQLEYIATTAPSITPLGPISSSAASSSSSIVHLIPAPQSIQLRASPLLLNRRHALELLCLVMIILVLLVLMQDSRWLAPISPILIYSLISVAHEPTSVERSTSPSRGFSSRPRPALMASAVSPSSPSSSSHLNTQGVSLFGYSMRVASPAPSPHHSASPAIRGGPNSTAATASSRSAVVASSSSSAAATSSSSRVRSPMLLPQHHHQPPPLSSTSLHTPLAIPFPSLATPVRAALLTDRERSFTPDTEDERVTIQTVRQFATHNNNPTISESPPVEQQQFRVTVASPSGSTSTAVKPQSQPQLSHSASFPSLRRNNEDDEEESKEVVNSPLDVPAAASIAASIAPSRTTLPPRSERSGSLIDVSATLSRLAPTPQHARSTSRPSMEIDTAPDSGVATSANAPILSERVVDGDFFRVDQAASLPASSITSSSFSLRFTFHHSFDDVSRVFLNLGDELSSVDETDLESSDGAVTPPHTPTASSGSFAMSEMHVDVVADSLHETNGKDVASSSSSSSSSPSTLSRRLIRRVLTPIKLPQLIRKLLGSLSRITLEERILVDSNGTISVQLINRDLISFISLYSMQTLSPHPSNPSHTQWSCKYKLYVFNGACGPVKGQVASWLSSMAKSRQQQISTFMSQRIKRNIKQQQQQQEEEDNNYNLVTPRQRQGQQAKRDLPASSPRR